MLETGIEAHPCSSSSICCSLRMLTLASAITRPCLSLAACMASTDACKWLTAHTHHDTDLWIGRGREGGKKRKEVGYRAQSFVHVFIYRAGGAGRGCRWHYALHVCPTESFGLLHEPGYRQCKSVKSRLCAQPAVDVCIHRANIQCAGCLTKGKHA